MGIQVAVGAIISNMNTSLEAYKKLDAGGLYTVIIDYLRSIYPDSSCIADIAHAKGLERSTVSARMTELKNSSTLLVYDGKRPSKRTGIKAMHWKCPPTDTLF